MSQASESILHGDWIGEEPVGEVPVITPAHPSTPASLTVSDLSIPSDSPSPLLAVLLTFTDGNHLLSSPGITTLDLRLIDSDHPGQERKTLYRAQPPAIQQLLKAHRSSHVTGYHQAVTGHWPRARGQDLWKLSSAEQIAAPSPRPTVVRLYRSHGWTAAGTIIATPDVTVITLNIPALLNREAALHGEAVEILESLPLTFQKQIVRLLRPAETVIEKIHQLSPPALVPVGAAS